MSAITKKLYALASGLDMVERSSSDDPLHQLVFGMTGKEHISQLTEREAAAVESELRERMKLKNKTAPLKSKKREIAPGMMTEAQQKKAWSLMYRLAELDPSECSVGERLVGVVKKTGTSSSVRDPFRFVTFELGAGIIEQLKRYVRSAERRSSEKGG